MKLAPLWMWIYSVRSSLFSVVLAGAFFLTNSGLAEAVQGPRDSLSGKSLEDAWTKVFPSLLAPAAVQGVAVPSTVFGVNPRRLGRLSPPQLPTGHPTGQTVLLIQDVHRNPTAQRNLSELTHLLI